jgi:hypothetical protein
MSDEMILIERAMDVAIGHKAGLSSDGREVFSLMPEVSLALEQTGHPYRILEEFTPAEEFNRMALERYIWLEGFLAELDERILQAFPVFKEVGVRPAVSHFFFFKILFDGLASTAQLQINAIRALRPSRVLFVPSMVGRFGREMFFSGESIHSRLAPLTAAAVGVEPVPLGTPVNFSIKKQGNPLWRTIHYCPRRPLARMFREKLGKFLARNKMPVFSDQHPQALVLTDSHDISLLLERLRRGKGWEGVIVGSDGKAAGGVPSLNDEAVADRACPIADRLWKSLETDASWQAKMFFHGVDIYPVARSRLEWFVRKGLPEAVALSVFWRRFLQQRPPVCVLGSSSNVGYAPRIPCSIARHSGVPMVLYQEGAGFGVPDCPIYDHTDLKSCDLFLGYGAGTEDHVKSRGEGTPCRAVGSARLESLKATLSDQQRRGDYFLYVPTRLQLRVQHHPYNGGSAPYYFEFQKRVLSVLSSFPQTRFVVKPPPSEPDHSLSLWLAWKRSAMPNCRVAEGPLRFFLPDAAGFILDFPSTTFLEALLTEKPIFICLDPRLTHLDPGAETLIARRAVVCHGIEELAVQLKGYLKGNPPPANFSETSVRRRFATHLDDGGGLERAFHAMEAVVGEGR